MCAGTGGRMLRMRRRGRFSGRRRKICFGEGVEEKIKRSERISLLLMVPPTGFEPVLPAPEADALSTELRGRGVERTIPQRLLLRQTTSIYTAVGS